MCQRAGAVHLRQVDNLAERFVMGRSVAAAACAESDSKNTAVGYVLVTDLQSEGKIL